MTIEAISIAVLWRCQKSIGRRSVIIASAKASTMYRPSRLAKRKGSFARRCPTGIDAEVTIIKPIAARPKVSHSSIRSYITRLSLSFGREPITQPFSAANSQAKINIPGNRGSLSRGRLSCGILRRGREKRINLTPSPDGQTSRPVVQNS